MIQEIKGLPDNDILRDKKPYNFGRVMNFRIYTKNSPPPIGCGNNGQGCVPRFNGPAIRRVIRTHTTRTYTYKMQAFKINYRTKADKERKREKSPIFTPPALGMSKFLFLYNQPFCSSSSNPSTIT